jgi:hypothetical protein
MKDFTHHQTTRIISLPYMILCVCEGNSFALQNPTEQVGSNGNIAHFYSRDAWFKSKLGHQLYQHVLWISSVAAGKRQGSTLN